MKVFAGVFILFVALFAGAFWWLSREPSANSASVADLAAADAAEAAQVKSRATHDASRRAEDFKKALGSSALGADGPAPTAPLAPTTAPRAAPVLTEKERLRQQSLARISDFESGRGWRSLVDRALSNPAAMDSEERYLAARAMDICEQQRNRQRNVAQEREQFVNGIAANDANRVQRINAFNQVTTDPCGQLAGTTYTRDQINQLLKDGRAAGDPKSSVLLVEKEVQANPQQARSAGLTHEQRSTLRDAVASLDPASIRRTGEILMASQTGWQNSFGPDAEKVEPWLVSAAWRLVACDNGMPCGPDSQAVLSACAYSGRCNATSQEQLLQMYELGSQRFQEVQRYRAIIAQAIAQGRWGWIGLGG